MPTSRPMLRATPILFAALLGSAVIARSGETAATPAAPTETTEKSDAAPAKDHPPTPAAPTSPAQAPAPTGPASDAPATPPPAAPAETTPPAAPEPTPAAPAATPEAAPKLQELVNQGRAWLEETFPDTDFSQLDQVDQAQLLETLGPIARAFEQGGFEDLAAMREHATLALEWLRAQPWGTPYADWLEPRMDYLEVATDTERAAAEQFAQEQHRATTPTPGSAPSAPSTLRFQVVRERVQRSAQSRAVWARRIAARPPPARAATLAPPLKEIFRAEGVPPEMVWLAEVESSFDPEAQNPVGARGLFQFMPATAQRFGLKTFPVDERTDPAKSAKAAAQYLRALHGRFGDWPLSLAAYNAGEGRVGRILEGSKTRTFDGIASQLPAETRLYVPKVMATVAAREGVDPFALPAPKEIPPAAKPAAPAAVGEVAPPVHAQPLASTSAAAPAR